MWDTEPKQQPSPKSTRFFLDWLEQHALTGDVLRDAEDIILNAEQEANEVKHFRTTVQTPPWHSEGPTVWFHVRRILSGVLAITNGADVCEIEEFAREKLFDEEVKEIGLTIRENAGSMITLALVHDLAKPDTVSLEAPQDSKGGAEGFLLHKRKREVASTSEQEHVMKLFRAFEANHQGLDQSRLTADFYDEYEIQSHYNKHDQIGASDKYEIVRETIGRMYHLSSDDLVRVQLIVKYHIEFLSAFSEKPSVAKYRLFHERASRAGLDADDFLDLLLAFTFLDSVVGCYVYRDGSFSAQTQVITNFLQSEFDAAPHRRLRRRENKDLQVRKRRKVALRTAKLLGDDIFSLLEIPFGPGRGEVVEKINRLVEDSSLEIDFGTHTQEMTARINEARHLLTLVR